MFTIVNGKVHKGKKKKHPDRKHYGSMWNFLNHHPSSVYNLTNTMIHMIQRGNCTDTMTRSKRMKKRAPKKGKNETKNLFQTFLSRSMIKFFNPEKNYILVQIRNVEKQQRQRRVESTENEMKTVVLLSVESVFYKCSEEGKRGWRTWQIMQSILIYRQIWKMKNINNFNGIWKVSVSLKINYNFIHHY